MVTKEDKKIMEEIKKDHKAYQWLKDKAVWERMSLYAVLKDYGNPRDFSKDIGVYQ